MNLSSKVARLLESKDAKLRPQRFALFRLIQKLRDIRWERALTTMTT